MEPSTLSETAVFPGDKGEPVSEGSKWYTNVYTIHINKSMKELREISDAHGYIPLRLDDASITIERTPSNPRKHNANCQIVHDVNIDSSRNDMPLTDTKAFVFLRSSTHYSSSTVKETPK